MKNAIIEKETTINETELLKNQIIELKTQLEAKKEKKEKAEKVYSLNIGHLPDKTKKALGIHAEIITEAIKELITAEINQATKNQIMEKAIEKGLYEKKPSVQNTSAIFSWWRKDLKDYQWINY